MTPFEWLLVVGVVLAFLALLSWVGASVGWWLFDLILALLPWDDDHIARRVRRLAVLLLLVGSVGRLMTEGV